MPPSIRRTISSPSVRPSPYPLAFSNSNVGSGRVHGHRRSSGSETSSRRVLADLEWWRVVDGQHDADAEQQTEERENVQDQDGVVSSQNLVGLEGVERPATPSTRTSASSQDFEGLPTSQFAALSIAPRTPQRLARRHTHTFEWSSSSSLESTPEATERPLECIRFAMLDSDIGFGGADGPPILPPFSLACALPLPPCTRPFDCSALLNDSAGRFADIGVASHDQNIFN